MITQIRLRELLHYCQRTGLFTRKVARGGHKIGSIVGTIDDQGYVKITIDGYRSSAHRLAFIYMCDQQPEEVDHINGVRSDNRFNNLRSCTRSGNQQNLGGAKSNNVCGLLGVDFHKRASKWRARIRHNGKHVNVGYFATAELAHEAYLKAKAKLHTHNERMVR